MMNFNKFGGGGVVHIVIDRTEKDDVKNMSIVLAIFSKTKLIQEPLLKEDELFLFP